MVLGPAAKDCDGEEGSIRESPALLVVLDQEAIPGSTAQRGDLTTPMPV